MNPAETMLEASWSQRHWVRVVGLVFGGQLLLLFLLADRTPVGPLPAREATRLSLALDDAANTRLNDPLLVGDPTMFALPHPRGFSGRAWLATPAPEHRLAGWAAPPGWLAANSNRLGQVFTGFAVTNAILIPGLAGKPEPRLAEMKSVPEADRPHSTMQVAGALQGRPLATQLVVPDLPQDDVLRTSVVQVLVNVAGEIFSTTLRSSSGLKTADDRALELSRRVRFQPLKAETNDPGTRFTAGTLIFTWHTVIPAPQPQP